MKLIINGDDLGLTPGINAGILQGYHDGILRSATAMVNGSAVEEAVGLTKDCRHLGIGLHLNLTIGKPLTENKTLHNTDGMFYRGDRTIFAKNPDYNEISAEWHAQMDRFIALFHHLPDHLDSHHHVADANDTVLKIAVDLAEEYHLPLRNHCAYTFTTELYNQSRPEDLIRILQAHESEDLEVMCHPAWIDLQLMHVSSYNINRIHELDILCSPAVKDYIRSHHIAVTNFTEN